MRYRPFGPSGKAVSAVSLLLHEAPNMTTAHVWRSLVISAMEAGVNAFEITGALDIVAIGLGEALRSVERRLIFLGWRIKGDPHRPLTAEGLSNAVRGGLSRTGAGYFDLLTLDEIAYETLTHDARTYLQDLQAGGLVLQLGVSGDGPAIDSALDCGDFDVLTLPFNLTSDWRARRRVRDASARNMTIIASNPFPPASSLPVAPQKRGLFHRNDNPLAGAGTYAFLHETAGWSSEELCLAYVLTEPTFATVKI